MNAGTDIVFTIETGRLTDFCCQAREPQLRQVSHIEISINILNYAIKKHCKTTQNQCFGCIQVKLGT